MPRPVTHRQHARLLTWHRTRAHPGVHAVQVVSGDVLVRVVRAASSSVQGGFAVATATGPADVATATVMSALTVLDGQVR